MVVFGCLTLNGLHPPWSFNTNTVWPPPLSTCFTLQIFLLPLCWVIRLSDTNRDIFRMLSNYICRCVRNGCWKWLIPQVEQLINYNDPKNVVAGNYRGLWSNLDEMGGIIAALSSAQLCSCQLPVIPLYRQLTWKGHHTKKKKKWWKIPCSAFLWLLECTWLIFWSNF